MQRKTPFSAKLAILLILMPTGGILVSIVVIFFCMHVGLFLEDNYELLFNGWKGIAIIAAAFGAGGVAPLLLLWRWIGDE